MDRRHHKSLLYEIAVVEGNTVATGFRIKSAGFASAFPTPLGMYRNEPQAIERKQNTGAMNRLILFGLFPIWDAARRAHQEF